MHIPEPPPQYHSPPAGIFRASWPPIFVAVLVLTLLVAMSTLVLAVAVGAAGP